MAGAPGTADVTARIATIQARIESLTAAFSPPPGGFEQALNGAGPADPVAPGGTAVLSAAPAPAAAQVAAPGTAATGIQRSLPEGAWVGRLSEAGQAVAGSIDAAAREHGIDPALLASVVRHESNFDQSVVSRSGAIGLAQLMPGTAEWLGVDPHDPEQNLRGGAKYLREQLDRFGSVDLAVAAYNAGPNAVARAGGIPQFAETQAYVPRVLATYQELT